jgi:hydroxypyruvate isomerase
MPTFAANLSMLFTEHAFLDRFAAAAEAGFGTVEFLFPYEHPAAEIRARLDRHRLTQALFNAPPGDMAKGERGLAIFPQRRSELLASIDLALSYAEALRCPRLHVMAGVLPAGLTRREAEETYVGNLREAAIRAAAKGVTLLIEPLNPIDMPGYFLTSLPEAARIIERVASPQLRLQLDLYHCGMRGEDIAAAVRAYLPITAHMQIAGVPGRHEPDVGAIRYPALFELIDSLGYQGAIGCEYRPEAGTLVGLRWARAYGIGAARKPATFAREPD